MILLRREVLLLLNYHGGAAQDLLSRTDAQNGSIYESSRPLQMGSKEQADVKIKQTESIFRPYVLDETPAVLSVSMRSLRSRTTYRSFLLRPSVLFQLCRRISQRSQLYHQLQWKKALMFHTKVIASEFVSQPVVKDAPRERGEAALRDEATSLQRLMCHTPKSPFLRDMQQSKDVQISIETKKGFHSSRG